MRRLILLTTTAFLLVFVASPAMAHSDTGLLTLEATPATEPLSVQVSARLVYANDRDPVSTATVTVTATGPNGATVASQPLASEGSGAYAAVIKLPVAGAWTFRANAIAPEARAETQFDAVGAPPTTAAPPTTPTTPQPAATTTSSQPAPAGAAVDSDRGGGTALLLGAVVLIAAITGAALWLRNRRRATG